MRSILGLFILLLLTACTGGGSSAFGQSSTAEEVHQAWVQAMRNNDRDAALAVAANMELKSAFVDSELNTIRGYVSGDRHGALQSVDVRPPTEQGAGREGISVWRFERSIVCFATTMASENGSWRVTRWGTIGRGCPKK